MANEPGEAEWELLPDGSLRLSRVQAFRCGIVAGLGVSLRLEFEAPDGEAPEAEQVFLDPRTALALAVVLQEKAAKALAPPPDGTPRN